VLAPDFTQKLSDIPKVMRPLVRWYFSFIPLFSLVLILSCCLQAGVGAIKTKTEMKEMEKMRMRKSKTTGTHIRPILFNSSNRATKLVARNEPCR
jgi:hypothetical protein